MMSNEFVEPFSHANGKRLLVPVLRPSAPETPGQFVACHLYDPVLNTGRIPTSDEFAAEYEAHYEVVQGMERRR
jgi:hypothetical protein